MWKLVKAGLHISAAKESTDVALIAETLYLKNESNKQEIRCHDHGL
jgi:hypothetical protein